MDRWKNFGLWAAIFAFVPVVCQSFGWNVIPENYEELVTGLLSILVLAGILSNPTKGKWFLDN